jgi:hypothetical protein
MSTRLQIIVSDEEADRWRRNAKDEGVNLSEWIRRAVRDIERTGRSRRSVDERLAAVERAFAHPVRLDLPPLEEYLASEGDRFGDLPRP